jgi:hypothetical protein
LDPHSDNARTLTETPQLTLGVEKALDSTQQHHFLEEVSSHQNPSWLEDTGTEIIRATRSWIQYGTLGFAVICIVIGALEALFGR